MIFKTKLLNNLLIGIGIATLSHAAHADLFNFNAFVMDTEAAYSGSQQRDRLSERGIRLSADYLDQGGLTAGYTKTTVNMKNNATAINQNNMLISGRLNFLPDALPGRLTLRLDGHRINNNDATGDTSRVNVIAQQISWLAKDDSLYLDLGYAYSHYQNQLQAYQYTPTVGFALNGGTEWVQLRGYLIEGLNPIRASGKSSTAALETKWTHYFSPEPSLLPNSMTLGVTAGERIYTVDMSAQAVANLADLEKGSANLALSWDISRKVKFFVLAGQSRYSNPGLSNSYKLNVAHANVSIDW